MAPRVAIRAALPGDWPAALTLLRQRDDKPYTEAAVRALVGDFDPARCRGWLAFDGERPVGSSMVYPRTLRAGSAVIPAAYWGDLYVHPDYRKAMVYPRLPLEMFRGAAAAGLPLVLTATRRDSAAAHVRIGCRQAGELAVLVKPLRPFALVGKRKGVRLAAGPAGRVGDALFGVLARTYLAPEALRGGVEEIDWSSPAVGELAAMRGALAGPRLHQALDAETLRARFASNVDGEPYVLLGLRDGGGLSAAAVYRMAERGSIRVGVVMDACCLPGREGAARRVLAAVERRAHAAGAEAMLHLDGVPDPIRGVMRRLGYLRSDETYKILVWPKDYAPPAGVGLDPASWWFSFLDHDAL